VTNGREPRGEVVAVDGTETAATGRVLVPPGPEAVVRIVAVHGASQRARWRAATAPPGSSARAARSAQLPVPPFARVSELAAEPAGGPLVLGSETDLAPGT